MSCSFVSINPKIEVVLRIVRASNVYFFETIEILLEVLLCHSCCSKIQYAIQTFSVPTGLESEVIRLSDSSLQLPIDYMGG